VPICRKWHPTNQFNLISGYFDISKLKMSVVSLQEYRELIVRSGLLTTDAVQEQFSSYAPDAEHSATDSSEDGAAGFAKHLESSGLLTQWQNANLLRGRFRGLMFGKFRILRLLGAGGMGRVFLAENQMLQRQVALKILPKKLSSHSTALERFHREARSLARLSHNNIVRVHDVDVHEKTHYIVMEYVRGADLHRKVSKEGPLDETVAANFICQAAEGLAHAHQAGLIHRDVKPANMLINSQGEVKVLDLGLALLQTEEDGSLTADPTKALGTVDYISPEQAFNSRELEARTDIYSLGCSLYFLLTGTAPFGKGTNTERLLAHQLRDPTPINDIRQEKKLPPVGDSLVAICSRMMAKAPSDRFADAAEVAQALAPIGGNGVYIQSSSIDSNSGDFDGSQSSLDTASLQQLKTISEAASSTSIHSASKAQNSPARRSGRKPNRNREIYWGVGIGVVAVTLLAAGVISMQRSSPDSANSTTAAPLAVAKPPLPGPGNNSPFYVVGNNLTYHTGDCRFVQGKSNVWPVAQEVVDGGSLRPCRVCHPERE
jgi:serine/threonine protein kinase